MRRIVIMILVAASVCGCFKSESTDADVILRAQVQTEDGGEFATATAVTGYAFAVEATAGKATTKSNWTVASYDDAVAGRITNSETGVTISKPNATVVPYEGDETYLAGAWLLQVTATPAVLVVVDTEHKIYGYKQVTFGVNNPKVYMAVNFLVWRDKYTDSGWTMVNEGYVAPAAATGK